MWGIFFIVVLMLAACEPGGGDAGSPVPFNTGFEAYVQEEYEAAVEVFTPLAEQGSPEAQFYLGVMHENGHGVRKNIDRAMDWYRRAAGQGHDGAQFVLGLNYANGLNGVKEDLPEGAKWLGLAAEQGNHLAQHELGALYEWGRGVTRDFAQAHKWYTLASNQGQGAQARDNVTKKMTLAQIGKAQTLAAEWAATHGKLTCSICS